MDNNPQLGIRVGCCSEIHTLWEGLLSTQIAFSLYFP